MEAGTLDVHTAEHNRMLVVTWAGSYPLDWLRKVPPRDTDTTPQGPGSDAMEVYLNQESDSPAVEPLLGWSLFSAGNLGPYGGRHEATPSMKNSVRGGRQIATVDPGSSKMSRETDPSPHHPLPTPSSTCLCLCLLVSERDPKPRPACRRLTSRRSVGPLAPGAGFWCGTKDLPKPFKQPSLLWYMARSRRRQPDGRCGVPHFFCITPAQPTLSADQHAVRGVRGSCTKPDLDCSAVWARVAREWPWSLKVSGVEMFVFPSSGLPLGASRWVVVVPCSLDRRRRRIKLPA